ncbi:MAG TPA: T9SS type A sorting domain-containing protein [Chitinophaga sp.]|uniref:Ig-like domain-containing protein n=1 Tax=Chitinophaga sp. TaxID=1869181 RepID=UPI002BE5A115|nr:T9SS type A sorting domain-containing protein [Chitinophaga sp.]HVI47185.1 T9SS type A sorting domain-containing protein [Chitinophaga sp.]
MKSNILAKQHCFWRSGLLSVCTLLWSCLYAVSQNIPCDAATSQTSRIGGLLCISCSVDNPALAVDDDVSTYSSLRVDLSIAGYAQQTVIFPTVSHQGDSVKLMLSFPVKLLDLSLLGGVEVATYNGNTFNNDRVYITGSLIDLRLITPQQMLLTWVPAHAFDRVEIRLNAGLIGAFIALNVNYAGRSMPGVDVQDDVVGHCSEAGAVLLAAGPPGAGLYWYTAPTGGTPLDSGDIFFTDLLLADTTFYVEAKRNGCTTARVPVGVTVLPPGAGIAEQDHVDEGGSGQDGFSAIALTPQGQLLLGGTTASNDGDIGGENHGLTDIWLEKMDTAGHKIWSQTLGGTGRDSLLSLAVLGNHYFVTGLFNRGTAGMTSRIVCTDSSGIQIWSRNLTCVNSFVGAVRQRHSVIITGSENGALKLLELDSLGAVLYARSYSGNYTNDNVQFVPTINKGLVIVGAKRSGGNTGTDAFKLQLDSSLNQVHESVIHEPGDVLFVTAAQINGEISDAFYLPFMVVSRVDTLADDSNNYGNEKIYDTDNHYVSSINIGEVNNEGKIVGEVGSGNRLTGTVVDCQRIFVAGQERTNTWKVETFFIRFDTAGILAKVISLHPFIPGGALIGPDHKLYIAATTLDSSNNSDGELLTELLTCPPSTRPQEPVFARSAFTKSNKVVRLDRFQLQAYPNPFTRNLTIRYTVNKAGCLNLQLIGSNGKSVYPLRQENAGPGTYTLELSTGNYPAGLYLLQLEQGNERTISKVIKIQ